MDGDLELPPLSPDGELIVGGRSPTFGVTFPKYLLPIEVTSSDDYSEDDNVEDPDWDAKYADFVCDSNGGNSD